MKIFIIYLILVNIMSFMMMYIDKNRAINHKRRIPERDLFLFAIIGGSVGTFFGMEIFRHKTKHLKFVIGIPLILIIQVIIFLILYIL